SLNHTGPSVGPPGPPVPELKSRIGSDVEIILSSSGANRSILLPDCANAPPKLPPIERLVAAAVIVSMCRRKIPDCARMGMLPLSGRMDRWLPRVCGQLEP